MTCEKIQKIPSDLKASDMERRGCRTAWRFVKCYCKTFTAKTISLLPSESRHISGQFKSQVSHSLANWNKLTEANVYDGFIYFILHISDF